jgi:hypothetical protein
LEGVKVSGYVELTKSRMRSMILCRFVGLAYQGKKDIVFRFIIEYSSLRNFEGKKDILFLYEDF